ncbi:MAG: FAD-dependent oxidoreductase [Nostocoides sp.]
MAATQDPTWGSEWNEVVDVIVVGCGAAGASAAVTAVAGGASVAILEKAPYPGGTTARSGGMMWIPNNPLLQASGVKDERDAALLYMCRTAYPALFRQDHPTLGLPQDRYDVIASFYDRGSEAVEHHQALGCLPLQPVNYPAYFSHLDLDKVRVGRSIEPVLPDDYVPTRDKTGGDLLVERLVEWAVENGAQLKTDHEVVDLLRNDDGEVVGVLAHAGKQTVLIGARRGVIFASGGFLHNERMALDYLRGPVFGGAAASTATGDFVRIGTKAGAQLGNMAHAWWAQDVLQMVAAHRVTSFDVYSPFGDSMIQVNRHGVRVVDEKAPYNERTPVHFQWDFARAEFPNLLMFMIFDEAVIENPHRDLFRWPVPVRKDRGKEYLIVGEDLDELARNIDAELTRFAETTGGVHLAEDFLPNLRATIERFNTMAATGVDEDFGRGGTPIEQRWAAPARKGAASASMFPISGTGPYYCVILTPGALDTKGGPVTDGSARVLSVDGEPIPGLYGAGNCIAAPAGQTYWGPGGTVGPALVFGYIAAKDAIAVTDRVPS